MLNNMSISSSHVLNTIGFLAHGETESVTVKIIQLLRNKNFSQEAIFYVFMLQEHKKSSYYFLFARNKATQSNIASRIWTVAQCGQFMLYN